jgi:hypothetical protein
VVDLGTADATVTPIWRCVPARAQSARSAIVHAPKTNLVHHHGTPGSTPAQEGRSSMTPREAVHQAWADEHAAARSARAREDEAEEWRHLERAHILSQPMAGPHVRTHLAMLGFGVRHRRGREVLGQAVRLIVAGPGSWTGRYPMGNTGGADVSALRPMPVPDDLRAILDLLDPSEARR